MGYTKDVIKGISWTGTLSFVTKLVGFLETLILARILLPSQFGAYGVALLALGLLETITQTGVNIVLIQQKETEQYISSAWIVSIFRGIVIMLLMLLATPFTANFFHSPSSLILLYLLSVVPFLRGFINPSVVKLQKDLLFKKNFWYQTLILFVDTATSITITFLTKQPIGIAIGMTAGVLVELFFSFIIVTPRPKIEFDKDYIATIFHRGKWVTFSAIFDYLFFNSDNVAVGRILGTTSLGIYQLGYSLAVTPLVEVSNVFAFVTFPVFTRLTDDPSRLRRAFFKSVLSVGFLTIPFVCIFVFIPQVIVFLLGSKWSAITTILPLLAILGFVKALANTSASLFLSEVKQKYATVVTLVTIVGMLAGLIPLTTKFGIVGAATAALIGTCISLPCVIWFVYKIFQYKFNQKIYEKTS